MSYPFVKAGAPSYGIRKGPALGLLYHMAEGGNTVAYLSHSGVPRGVSVHAVCDYSGRVTQMLNWEMASGSLNPRDTSSDKPYFGHSHLVDVLGLYWNDPNSAVLSMEIEGFASRGPNPAQIDGAVAWGEDMKARFSALRGALGHADQTNTKACPGTSTNMRLVFEGVGGHGLWHPQGGTQQPPVLEEPVSTFKPAPGRFAVPVGTPIFDAPNGKAISTVQANSAYVNGMLTVLGGISGWRVCVVNSLTAAWVAADKGQDFPPVVPAAPDCTNAVAAEHERTRQAAIDAVTAIK